MILKLNMQQAKEKYFHNIRMFSRSNYVWSYSLQNCNVDLSGFEKKYNLQIHSSIKDYFNVYKHDDIFGDCMTKSGANICIVLATNELRSEKNPNHLDFSLSLDDWIEQYKGSEYTPIGSDGGQCYYCAEVLVNNSTGKIYINWGGDRDEDFDIDEIVADDLADLISKMADSLQFNEYLRHGEKLTQKSGNISRKDA